MTDENAREAPLLLMSAKERATLTHLIRKHLPGIEVWAYGSRTNGRGHDGSDLDLVLRTSDLKEVPILCSSNFREAVQDSNLPFLVEVHDWAELPERFHREIEKSYVVLS